MHSEVMSCDLKGASGPGACLFKNKSYVLAGMTVSDRYPFFLFILEICRKIHEVLDLLCGKVLHLEQITAF